MSKVNSKIDMVLLWVDGNDKEWQMEKNKYDDKKGDSRIIRYRDCDNLQYLFRGIEKYAPWVNKIYFITWGHLPSWLDVNNEKLVIVKHEDFIPKEYLPTFNSNVIELNLHRIKSLSEQFILLNDDIFILKKTLPEDFFVNGLPTDTYVEKFNFPFEYNDTYYMMLCNILAIINNSFNKELVYRKNMDKYINDKYKELNDYTKYSMKIKDGFIGFGVFHKPHSYLKSTFNFMWENVGEYLDNVCHNKFRKSSDLGHLLCEYWQMLTGNFEPKENECKYIYYKGNNTENINELKSEKYKYVCINDVFADVDFEKSRDEINATLQELFPKKSSFEI